MDDLLDRIVQMFNGCKFVCWDDGGYPEHGDKEHRLMVHADGCEGPLRIEAFGNDFLEAFEDLTIKLDGQNLLDDALDT